MKTKRTMSNYHAIGLVPFVGLIYILLLVSIFMILNTYDEVIYADEETSACTNSGVSVDTGVINPSETIMGLTTTSFTSTTSATVETSTEEQEVTDKISSNQTTSKSTTIISTSKEKSITTTTTTTTHYVQYKHSKRVHSSACKYAKDCDNSDNWIVVEDGCVEEGLLCPECNPDVEILKTYEEPTTEKSVSASSCAGYFQGTYYTGGYGTTGASGRTLQSGYSVASNYFPLGSIIEVRGYGELNGTYRVDDTGGMGSNVLDFYYSYGGVPSKFSTTGRVYNLEVYRCN